MTQPKSSTNPPKIRLLVAEDSPNTRHNLTNILGLEPDIEIVGSVGGGRQAIDLAAQLKPTVILMDINLPDMDGLTATSHILKILPLISVIIMSVHDEGAYKRRALEAGAKAFLTKPFSGDELMDIIRKSIARG